MQLEKKFKNIKKNKPFYKINDNLLMIFQGKTSVDFNSCNSYIIKNGNNATVLDPGTSRRIFTKALKELEIQIENIKNIILTHCHSDHYVLVEYIKKKARPDVYIHYKDQEFLENSNIYIDFLFDKSFFKQRTKFKEFYHILEYYSSEYKDKDIPLNPAIKSVFDTWKIYSITADHIYKDGEILPGNLKAFHLPGHTPGQCGIHYINNPIFFCADIDFNTRGPIVSGKYSSIRDYKESIKKLITIIRKEKIKQLYPGHWNPLFYNLETNLNNFYHEFTIKENIILELLRQNEKITKI